MISDAQKAKLIEALNAPGKSWGEKLIAIGEDPASYPASVLEDLDWLSNIPQERISYIMKMCDSGIFSVN